jgi:Xaa-Pro aminopeptidase
MAQQGLDALVIYGDNYAYADLCYLTNYFPKVRGGIGIIPRSGPISLLLNIGSRDVPFAKSLTWVDDVRASGQLGRDGAGVLKEKGLAQAKVGLMDSGKGFPLPQLEELKESLPQVQWQPSHSMLQQMRLRKSAKELAALREAGRVLNGICDETREFIKAGRKEYEIIADIDRLARDQGVEDIRILAGEKRYDHRASRWRRTWAIIRRFMAIQHSAIGSRSARVCSVRRSKLQSAYQRPRRFVAQMAIQLKAAIRSSSSTKRPEAT